MIGLPFRRKELSLMVKLEERTLDTVKNRRIEAIRNIVLPMLLFYPTLMLPTGRKFLISLPRMIISFSDVTL